MPRPGPVVRTLLVALLAGVLLLGTGDVAGATGGPQPRVAVGGEPALNRSVRADVAGGRLRAVRWSRCLERPVKERCPRARRLGRGRVYRVRQADVGHYLRVAVRVTTQRGETLVVRSAWVGPVTRRGGAIAPGAYLCVTAGGILDRLTVPGGGVYALAAGDAAPVRGRVRRATHPAPAYGGRPIRFVGGVWAGRAGEFAPAGTRDPRTGRRSRRDAVYVGPRDAATATACARERSR